jgi:outer membrane protein assembly factor BamB
MGGWSLLRRRLVVGVAIAVFGLLTAQVAAAVDGAWLQAHHDPSGTDANAEVTTITPRTVTTLRPVWRSTPTDGYYGGATVAGGVAYAATGWTDVRAINVATGAVLWRREFASPARTVGTIVGDKLVYVGVSLEGVERLSSIYALDRADGHVVWRHAEPDGGSLYRVGVLAGSRLYVAFAQGQFLALDAATGQVSRRLAFGNANPWYGTAYADDRLYTLGYGYAGVVALSAADGSYLWGYASYGFNTMLPAVADGLVFVAQQGTDNNTSWLSAFPAAGCGASTCLERWRTQIPGTVFGQPAVSGGRVFVPTGGPAGGPGGLWVLDEASGRVLWSWTGGGDNSAVSVGGGVAYVVAQQMSALYAFAAAGCGASSCQPLSVVPNLSTGSSVMTEPAIADGTVVVTAGGGVWGLRPTTLAAAPVTLVGARASDNTLRVRRSDATGWIGLGGQLASAPAVIADPARTYYIVEGADHLLYTRTSATSWTRISSTACRSPAAALSGTVVYVACRGGDGALWATKASIQQGRVGSVGSLVRLGGTVVDGPAVTIVNGSPLYAVTGTDGVIRTRTTTTGWVGTPLRCTSRPAAASGGGSTYLACRSSSGALVWSRNVGAGFAPARSAGGVIVGGPGIAVDGAGRATAYVQGTNGSAYRKRLDPATSWGVLSGLTVRGVGATQIRS